MRKSRLYELLGTSVLRSEWPIWSQGMGYLAGNQIFSRSRLASDVDHKSAFSRCRNASVPISSRSEVLTR
jgi:hypothetical protein